MPQGPPMSDTPRPPPSQHTFFLWTTVAVVLALVALLCGAADPEGPLSDPQGLQDDLAAT
jgi:hypothetical protein